MSDASLVVAGRSCGACTLCCKVLAIDELHKPHGEWCPHAKPGRGCGIYTERPGSCREFHCGWLVSEGLSEAWFPANSKIVLMYTENGITAVVDAGRPDAWKIAPYYQQLKTWSVAFLQNNRQVLVRIGNRTIAILPEEDADLGPMDPGGRVIIETAAGPGGSTRYRARRADSAPADKPADQPSAP
jgi:hypothetical protein